MRKFLKETKGITLIALVLTIIILLILVGVTIATLTGDNGILSQAQNASEVTEIAQVEEGLQLEYSNVLIGKHAGNENISDENAILADAISNYNTRYPEREPIIKENVGGELTISKVTLDSNSLQIGLDTTNSSNRGTITVTVDSSSDGGDKYLAQVKGKKYEVTIDNGIIKILKTPITTTTGAGGLVIEATVEKTSSNETIATASVGETVATETGSETVVTVTGNGTAGNTTVEIDVNGSPYSVALVAKATILPGGTATATVTDNYTDTNGKTATVPKGYTVSNVEGEKLVSQGLVISKGSDKYVWIEVPRTGGPDYSAVAGTTVDTPQYYTAIEAALINYAGFAKTGDNLKTTRYGWKDEWYSGCGISNSTKYVTQYRKMLKSVYTNGGFWIGRYEASAGASSSDAPLSQSGKTAQTLTCSNAQIAATKVSTSDTGMTSSLMFGLQWDLVCKFLEGSTEWPTEHEASWYIKTDSTTWGNYSGQGGLKDTGTSGYKRMNIYDFAGNQWEWTLEHATSNSSYPCARRGGSYSNSGSDNPASFRDYNLTSNTLGFRVSLY